eukprot:gnl/TRDRNA2_/TRDRNA2_160090_c0_seq1.p1 gnl/TRDRNA2_/TRDRNA2_160090_c0~~gnl/TRDRNA2_/TRDRNA2_160090_c0_seq1.p1  ORF type:complete len:126 (+),score=12.77 gnl/TRDRNA2_/TRDRNA2_160090_c0_seq1:182-559(+)
MKRGKAIVDFEFPEEAEAAVQGLDRSVIEGNSRYIDVTIFVRPNGHAPEPAGAGADAAYGVKKQRIAAPTSAPRGGSDSRALEYAAKIKWMDCMEEAWRLYCICTPSHKRSSHSFLAGLPSSARF